MYTYVDDRVASRSLDLLKMKIERKNDYVHTLFRVK